MDDVTSITLIGMPASGKSTVGKLLARRLGLPFVDGDDVIQNVTGKTLEQLIAAHGNEAFLDLEADALCTITGPAVIAPGGSVVYRERGIAHLRAIGPVIFLDVPADELKRRIGDLRARGVVLPAGMTFDDLIAQRVPLYRQWATACLDAGPLTAEAAADEILKTI